MLHHDVITKSLSYKLIRALFLCFLMSGTYNYAKRFIGTMLQTARDVIVHSESKRLFTPIYDACRKNMRTITLFTSSFILICHLSLDFLTHGRIRYGSILILCVLFLGVYFARENARRRIISIFTNSLTSKVLNKKI